MDWMWAAGGGVPSDGAVALPGWTDADAAAFGSWPVGAPAIAAPAQAGGGIQEGGGGPPQAQPAAQQGKRPLAAGGGSGSAGGRPPAKQARARGAAAASGGAARAPAVGWEQALEILQSPDPQVQTQRPDHFDAGNPQHFGPFIERPRVRRPTGTDKWLNSGGAKGATLYWHSPGLGVRKRYGKVHVSNGGAEYRFVQFTLVRGTKDKPQEDKDGAVFVVDKQLTKQAQVRPASTQLASKPDADPNSAVLDVVAPPADSARFISFQSSKSQSGTTFEMGAIVKQGRGITLESSSGDFVRTRSVWLCSR